MSRLQWTEIEQGWVAGHYHIEQAGPDLWVCSRVDLEWPRIELTSDSLPELQRRIEKLERRRRMARRAVAYFVVMAIATALMFWAATWGTVRGPMVVFPASAVASFSLIGLIDSLVGIGWDPPNQIIHR